MLFQKLGDFLAVDKVVEPVVERRLAQKVERVHRLPRNSHTYVASSDDHQEVNPASGPEQSMRPHS